MVRDSKNDGNPAFQTGSYGNHRSLGKKVAENLASRRRIFPDDVPAAEVTPSTFVGGGNITVCGMWSEDAGQHSGQAGREIAGGGHRWTVDRWGKKPTRQIKETHPPPKNPLVLVLAIQMNQHRSEVAVLWETTHYCKQPTTVNAAPRPLRAVRVERRGDWIAAGV